MQKTKNRGFKPYIIEAFYQWTEDSEQTAVVTVIQNKGTILPEHLKDYRECSLHLSKAGVSNLQFQFDFMSFFASFNGVLFLVKIPYSAIIEIHNIEEGYSLTFDVVEDLIESEQPDETTAGRILKFSPKQKKS